jgi:hypothetical protein
MLVAERGGWTSKPTSSQPIFLSPRSYNYDDTIPDAQATAAKRQDRQDTLIGRQLFVREFLLDYMASKAETGAETTEYIWMDEFCLSDKSVQDVDVLKEERQLELGWLADIFRAAQKVCVFCHVRDCKHVDLHCH